MKLAVLLLSVLVAVQGGMLMFVVQSGRLPFQEAVVSQEPESAIESAPPATLQSSGLVGEGVTGMIAELADALKEERQKLLEDRQQLDKREKNVKELHDAYLKMRQMVEKLQSDLETQLIQVDKNQDKNFTALAEVYENMDPASAARALQHMDSERAALILFRMGRRELAAVMDSAVTSSADGSEAVALWSDAIRRMSEIDSEGAR